MDQFSSTETEAIKGTLGLSADQLGNDSTIEMHWAMKAFHHAETYFNLITSLDPKNLKISKIDDKLYESFKRDFPDMKVDVLDENEMKSPEGKQKWRTFCGSFDNQVPDWNMGTLVRLNADGEISQDNTTIVPRIQFLAIEVARNREGFNSGLQAKYGKAAS